MRLRTIPLLVVIVACVAALGAWTDRPHYQFVQVQPVTAATKPWTTVVKVTRRGRPLDGYRAIITLTGPRGSQRVAAQELGGGIYRFRVKLAHGGFYTYTILVGDRIAGRGTVYSVPQ